VSPKYHRRRVVYTCLFGSSEAFNDFTYERDPDIDFVCFTDDSELRSNFWRVEYVPSGLLDPPRASKKVKHLPHRYLSAYRESLYLDNTVQLKRPARELFDELLCPSPSPWVAFRHPWRQCIYDEADEVVRLGYDAPERVNAQVQFYRRLGYPPKNGLVKGAALLRRHHDPAVVAVGEDWFQQVLRHSVRDQISLPVVAWHHGFLFCLLDQDFLDNEFVQWPVHGPRLPRDFDEDRYLSLNPDVHGTDPRRHYLQFGITEGRRYK